MDKELPKKLINPIKELLKARKKMYDANQEMRKCIEHFNDVNKSLFNHDMSLSNMIIDCRILLECDNTKIILVIDEDGEYRDFEHTGLDYELRL